MMEDLHPTNSFFVGKTVKKRMEEFYRGSPMEDHKDTDHAKKVFEAAKPSGWVWDTEKLGKSGQGAVCYVKHTDGRLGVFKCLKGNAGEPEKQRFWREVRTLRKIDHKNVVKLLESGGGWYITQRGTPLSEHWPNLLKSVEPEKVQSEALALIRGIASGLAECHSQGLVHRDVKPENIVVMENDITKTPVLIDFGLVYDENDEGHTRANEAIGNRQCTHDHARFHSDSFPPWGDVFSLMQVFQWMMANSLLQGLRWVRPIHWKYVSYRPGVSDSFAASLRTASAVCSMEETCPQDGTAFLQLLDNLYGVDMSASTDSHAGGFGEALAAAQNGTQLRELKRVTDISAIDASLQLAEDVITNLKNAITAGLRAAIQGQKELEVLVIQDDTVKSFYPLSAYDENPSLFDGAFVCFVVRVSHTIGKFGVGFRLQIEPLCPSRNVRKLDDGSPINMFSFVLIRTGVSASGREISGDGEDSKSCIAYLGFDSAGNLWEFTVSFERPIGMVPVSVLVERCIERAKAPELWRIAASV